MISRLTRLTLLIFIASLLSGDVSAAEKPVNLRLGTLAPRGTSYHKSLQAMGFAIPYENQAGTYQRYTGDTSVPGKGEILVWRPHSA